MVRKKKGSGSKQRKPRKETQVEKKPKDVQDEPKEQMEQMHGDSIQEDGEIPEEKQPEISQARSRRRSPKQGYVERRSPSRTSTYIEKRDHSAQGQRRRAENRQGRKSAERRGRPRSRERKSLRHIRRRSARRGRESFSPMRYIRRRAEWSRSRSRDRRGGNPFSPRHRSRSRWDSPQSRNRGQDRPYNLPKDNAGHFDNAMNLIASNAEPGAGGIFSSTIDGRNIQSRHEILT